MSIGLFIGYHDPAKEDHLVPIASDAVFAHHWKPRCAQLKLRWVPRFPTGWTMSAHDVAPILMELTQLSHYLAGSESTSEIRAQMQARLQTLTQELEDFSKSQDAEAFIGPSRRYHRQSPVTSAVFAIRPVASAERSMVSEPVVMAWSVPDLIPEYPLPGKTAPTKPSRASWTALTAH